MKKRAIQRKVIHHTPYFEKKYDDIERLKKVLLIHHLLEKNNFSSILPIQFSNSNALYQEWCTHFRHANYELKEDRRQIFNLMKQLHATQKQIKWKRYKIIPKYSLYKKWKNRIEKFEAERHLLQPLFPRDYDELLERASTIFKQLQSNSFEDNLTLCHGDIAHHNFIYYKRSWKIIDFDLAFLGSASEEIISWVQRVLPFMNYELLQLLEEIPELLQLGERLTFIAFPNEEMREMMHYKMLSERERLQFYPFLEKFLRKSSEQYESLQNQLQSVL